MKAQITLAAAVSCLLAACSSESEAPQGEVIQCAIGAGAEFAPSCTYQEREGGREVVVYHPDGGFRRFSMLPGGAGVASTDGAEQVIQGMMGNNLEVTVGEDRYLFPTTPAQ
ncbi:hypothetical protein AMC99_01309 [Altererythrobacter epoxidivorans]|uniref:Lipoprotein n=1 Tax=Altererythrobacter epoxidivorans TaxID=361183 RepID=A0A0M4M4C2_9SPHN|nr:hypothetical protein [Altererythrobacter epoxidivorans]ALE16603.1 hypothetical protein AMC99_01309 [Altererythrobacter epoxidivorans]